MIDIILILSLLGFFALIGIGILHSFIVIMRSDDYKETTERTFETLKLELLNISEKDKDTDLSLIFLASPITAPLFIANMALKETERPKYIAHFKDNIRITISEEMAKDLKIGSKINVQKTSVSSIYHRKWWQEPILFNYAMLPKECRLKDKSSDLKISYKII